MKYSVVLPLSLMVVAMLSLSGCASMSFSGSVNCTPGQGCTKEGSITVKSSGYSCNLAKTCRKEGGIFEDFLSQVGNWAEKLLGIQAALASDVGFDASQIRIDLSTSNVAFTNSTGNFIVSVYNGKTLVTQNEFSYYRSANSLYVTDPGSINSWISSISSAYDSVQVANLNNDLKFTTTTTADTTATVSTSTVYQGTIVESDSINFRINKGGCGIGVNCKQF